MYNNRNNFGDIPGPPAPPDGSFGMVWPGNNHMMQPMMPQMMQPMMPGMMPGYNYAPSNDQNPNYNAAMLLPPPVPLTAVSVNTGADGNVPVTIGPQMPPNMTTKGASNTPPNQLMVMPQVNSAPPVPDDEMKVATQASAQIVANSVATHPADESRKRPHSRSPNRLSSSSRDRKKWESDRSSDAGQGRRQDDGGSFSNKRGDNRRRSRSRERSRRDRSTRRSKWDSGDKDDSRDSRGPTAVVEGVMMMPQPGGIMPGSMFAGNMYPANMEMMGQAQLEMMKKHQMGAPPPMTTGMIGGGMMMDPSVMGMQSQMFPQMYSQNVVFSAGVLEPPYPGTVLPPRRARPPGCRTIFVGGLPDAVREESIKEIFERFGKILSMRVKKGFCHVRFNQENSVEASFSLSGYRLTLKNSTDETSFSSGLLIDYALNRDDQHEHERQRQPARGPTPPRVEHISSISSVSDKIKSEDKFAEAVPTLIAWLEGGECSKKNANTFYSMIQATNNHTRRLMNDKMVFDEEVQEMKDKMREKATKIITQLEQVVKVLNAANHKRVWDHFTKLQRKNVETWFKMSEELLSVRDEFSQFFNEDETDQNQKKMKATSEEINEIKMENENLMFELEACKNEVYVSKTEAAREFEKFKAHFIAEQALMNAKSGTKMPPVRIAPLKPPPPPPIPEDKPRPPEPAVDAGEARLISVVSMFLLVHPLGASVDYILSYVRSLYPATTHATIHTVLQKHGDVFTRNTTGVGAQMEHRWSYIPFKFPME